MPPRHVFFTPTIKIIAIYYSLYPCGFKLCQRQVSAHIVARSRLAVHLRSLAAFHGSA